MENGEICTIRGIKDDSSVNIIWGSNRVNGNNGGDGNRVAEYNINNRSARVYMEYNTDSANIYNMNDKCISGDEQGADGLTRSWI